MSTDLMVYQKVVDPLAFMKEAGYAIAKSKFFGCETVEQGQALMLIAMTEKLPILELRRRYHVINGDLTMRADYMRAELRRIGGDYEWVKDGEDGVECIGRWTFRGRTVDVSYTIEDAKREGLVKAKSRWEKDPGSMLRARNTTKAIRMVASEVLAGFYTEEELGHEIKESVNGNGHATAVAPPAADDVIDVEVSQVTAPPAEPADAAKPVDPAVQPAGGACSAQQSNRIKELWGLLGATPEQRDKMLKKRGAAGTRNLTASQADELIAALESRLDQQSAPCTADQAEAIRAKLKQVEQLLPGTIGKVKAKMGAAGLAKFDQLRATDAAALLDALGGTEMEAFFGQSLWPVPQQPRAEEIHH